MTKTRIIIYFIVIPLVAFIVAGGVFIAVKQEKTGNITDTTILPSVENTADPSIGTSGTDSPSVPDIKTDGTEEHMYNYCRAMPDCKIPHLYGDQWGFRILTRDYALYLRCIPKPCDYNFYVFCYDKEMLMNKLAKDRGLPRYCYAYLPTTHEEIRIDFAESGYIPYRKQGTAEPQMK